MEVILVVLLTVIGLAWSLAAWISIWTYKLLSMIVRAVITVVIGYCVVQGTKLLWRTLFPKK